DAAATLPGLLEPFAEHPELDRPTHHRRGRGGELHAAAELVGRRSDLGSDLEELPVELFGGSGGLGAKFTLEDIDAHLVLPEPRATPTLLGVEGHQRLMHRFLRRIQAEEPYGGLDGLVDGTLFHLMFEQSRETLANKFA